ncbi:MAG: MFS transporter [Deltaproteobacteria bacterium]|nr:MFS transporter [Deltaproteobacteria bacterium]
MKRYIIFSALGLGLLMYSVDTTIVAVAFPHIIRDLKTNLLWAGWTMSIYMIAITSSMPLIGNISDIFGRKRIYLFSVLLFTLSSFACGLAPDVYTLILFRFIQGVGGACFLPNAAGIVSDLFPKERVRAIGFFTSIFPIGGIIGPNLGGYIVEHLSWRYVFFINIPIGIIVGTIIGFLLKEKKNENDPEIDYKGAILFLITIFLFMLGLNLIADNPYGTTLCVSILCFFLSFLSFYLFTYHERSFSNPLIEMSLLKSTPFLAANIYNMVVGMCIFAVFSFIPFFATSVHKLSILKSGAILTPRAVGTIPASFITSLFLDRWGYRKPMIIGLMLIALSTVFLSDYDLRIVRFFGVKANVVYVLTMIIFVMGIGMGISLPASNNACIELMPEKVATITGLRGTFRTTGGFLGISLISLVLHFSSSYDSGFRVVFISSGILLISSLTLVFLMPEGKRGVQPLKEEASVVFES